MVRTQPSPLSPTSDTPADPEPLGRSLLTSPRDTPDPRPDRATVLTPGADGSPLPSALGASFYTFRVDALLRAFEEHTVSPLLSTCLTTFPRPFPSKYLALLRSCFPHTTLTSTPYTTGDVPTTPVSKGSLRKRKSTGTRLPVCTHYVSTRASVQPSLGALLRFSQNETPTAVPTPLALPPRP